VCISKGHRQGACFDTMVIGWLALGFGPGLHTADAIVKQSL